MKHRFKHPLLRLFLQQLALLFVAAFLRRWLDAAGQHSIAWMVRVVFILVQVHLFGKVHDILYPPKLKFLKKGR